MVPNHNSTYDLHRIVGEAIFQQLSSIDLKGTKYDDVRIAIRIFMRKHPEVFWFSHQYSFDEATSKLYLKYNFTPKKREFFSKEIDNAVRFIFQPDKLKYLSDLEKVAYVYKWIVNNTTYNEYSSFNQTIYSVLINRNSVCTGYAKTAQYLLGILGIESELVFGKFHADKSKSGRHGWNIVRIDGEWYHVDFCLADPALRHLLNKDESPIEFDGLLWNYFCKPTECILKNRSIEFLAHYPDCNKEIKKQFEIPLSIPQKQLAVCKSDSGSTAKIYLDSFNKNQVMKIARHDIRLIDNEYFILTKLEHCKHILRFIYWNVYGPCLEQLTPWGELLNSHYYYLDENDLKNILIQLTEGLIECRDNGITYSDIHYNNVFVTKEGIYKWGDFGIAYPSHSDGTMPEYMIGNDGIVLGSRWFMAPETFHQGLYTESSAIYSLAMLAYFVMNDMRPPFLSDNISARQALKQRLAGLTIPSPVGSSLFCFLSRLVCDILNANITPPPNTFEAFISLLKSDGHYITNGNVSEIILMSLKDDEIFIKDNNSSRSNDFDNNDLGYSLNDSFAQTMEESFSHKLIKRDPDFFATSIKPYTSQTQCHNRVTYDTDIFALTWGSILTQSFPATTHWSDPHTENSSNPTRRATSFFPAKGQTKSTKHSARKKFGIGSLIGSALNRIGGLFIRRALGTSVNAADLNNNLKEVEISACVYAPSEVLTNKPFIIRVYMYLPNEQEAIESKVKAIDPQAVKKEYKPLDIPIKGGDKLTVQLDLSDGLECKHTTKTVIWKGHYTDCSFLAKLVNADQVSVEGVAYILVNDVPAGEMLFTIDVVDNNPKDLYTKVESHRFSKIFISYSHQDESQVRGIAEGCRMLGKDYFFDRHTLQAGDIFKDKILDYIDKADLFVLCWSKNAAKSEWVRIERERALQLIREGKSSLSIYPLCLRPEAPLPVDMADKYNFGTL